MTFTFDLESWFNPLPARTLDRKYEQDRAQGQ